MSLDGFNPAHKRAFLGLDRRRAETFYDLVVRLGDRLGVEVTGLENLPAGRALLVANHTFGFDVVFPMAHIHRRTGRFVWALGEHAWWRFPFIRRLAAQVGTVDGTPENADALLDANQLVLVMPGGVREAMKPRELRYRLLWGEHYGFVRAAIRNQAPVLPLAAVGADEIIDLVGDAFDRGERWIGRPFPIPRPALVVPRRVELRYILGKPLDLRARPEQADDPEVQRHARLETEGALEELIDAELARRAGFRITR